MDVISDNDRIQRIGGPGHLHFVWVVKFDDAGKICYMREHNDTAAISDAFKS